MDNIIRINRMKKIYHIYKNSMEKYFDFFLPGNYGKVFYALRNISFEVKGGTSVGLIGLNGSGKSTLANIIAGASAQTKGIVDVKGSAAMISVSAGLSPLLTGSENIIQKCLMLGMSRSEIRNIMPNIIEFSELGNFINQEVKSYSSGMKAKLGFAISININPDILIIDEALSVGDPTFTNKCLKKMEAFRNDKKTIIFVSHSLGQVRDFCDQVIWLEGGRVRENGECRYVLKNYESFISSFNKLSKEEQMKFKDDIYKSQIGE